MSHERDRFPLSFAQQRMWFLSELDPATWAYNLSGAIRMRGRLDRQALERALDGIVERHETLRTVIETEDGIPVQAVAPQAQTVLELVDLSSLEPAERGERAREIVAQAGKRAFDLSRGPLLRTVLIRLDESEHVFVAVIHHVVSDAWSIGIFFQELSELYRAFSSGEPSSLPELPIQYGDFAYWQRESLTGERLENHQSYWKRKLEFLPTLELPADRTRPASPSMRGAREVVVLAESLTSTLEELSLRERGTLFMTLWTAFVVLLHRYSGQEDIAIGAAIAGRNRKELEGLIGVFVNTLVLRSDLGGNPTFVELLRRSREVALDAYEHQDLPFEKLVEELHPQRELSRNPLFQVMFGFQNVPELSVELSGLELSAFEMEREVARFDLTLFVRQSRGRLVCELEYAKDLFDSDRIGRFLRHFENLLEGIAANPQARLSDLPLLSEEERSAVVEVWSDRRNRQGAAPLADSIHGRFERQARRRPDSIALTLPRESGARREELTYGALEESANRLANHLVACGVGPEVKVAICLERSLEVVTAILAVLKSGGAYVPLDPHSPEARLRWLAQDSRAAVVVTERSFAASLEGTGARLLCLDEDGEEIGRRSSIAPRVEGGSDRLAYVIYTSGSTGTPKGVEVTHGNVQRLLDRTEDWYRFGEDDVWTLFHSYAFDFSVWEIWGALLYGGRLVVVPHWLSRSPREFYELLGREGVTVLNQTPSAFRQLASIDGKTPAHLRHVIFGGEALHPSDWRPWVERHGDGPPTLVNMYGITETTVHVTYRPLSRKDLGGDGRSLIGRPIPDLELYLLDRYLSPVPIGVPGEIFVGGEGLARGYLNRPEITAERFVPHPFARVSGERLYRSGDLAVRLPDGELEYLGRVDHQVKLRGFRVELGEIENVLEEEPAVERAVALVRKRSSGEDRIVAYVVPDRNRAYHVRKRLELGKAETLELPDGRAVAYLNPSETRFMYQEIFERQAYDRHGIAVEDGAVVIDVGANIGLFSLFASDSARDVTIHAFEPVPEVFEALSRNQNLHGWKGTLHPSALGASPGREEFVYYPKVSVLSGRFGDRAAERQVVLRYLENEKRAAGDAEMLRELVDERLEERRFDCEIRTLSAVMRELGIESVDLLKIDVEKSELEVLRGIEDADWPRLQQIVVEVHDENGRLHEIEALLVGRGFEVEIEQDSVLEGTGLYNLYASRVGRRAPGGRSRAQALASPRSPSELVESLRRSARAKLPDYMVPSSFVLLSGLPLTGNGKLDLAALTEPDGELPRTAVVLPRTEAERVLASIWGELLGLEEIGVGDNFFEIGGDSILGIQVVSGARKAGWTIATKDIFLHQTLAELAAVAKPLRPAPIEPATESIIPLTPIQRWFFDQELVDPHHFNHALILEVESDEGLAERLAAAVSRVARLHDAFRLRFRERESGYTLEMDDEPGFGLETYDLSALLPAEADAAIDRIANSFQRRLDLRKGPLARTVFFEMPAGAAGKLLLICHHLVVDGVSWRILLSDLAHGVDAPKEPSAPRGSYRAWAAALARHSRSEALRQELPFWREIARESVPPLPLDHPESSADTYGSAERVIATLDREDTAALLDVPSALRVQVPDVLLTALVSTLGAWSGNRSFRIDLESHGREEIEGADPTETVGWFTSLYPVTLGYDPSAGLPELLETVSRELARVPRNGIGFGVLLYLSSFEGVEELRSLARSEVSFNYLGRFLPKLSSVSPLRSVANAPGANRHPGSRRHHPLEINAVIAGDALRVEWTYPGSAYDRPTMESLAAAYSSRLRKLLSLATASGEVIYSGSGFGSRMSSAELEKTLGQVDFE